MSEEEKNPHIKKIDYIISKSYIFLALIIIQFNSKPYFKG